jgi:hypothetical protein
MNKVALCLLALALAACQRAQPATQQVAHADVATPVAPPTSQAAAGTYSVTEIDGTKMTTVLAIDHTYTDTVHGRRTEAGAWAIVAGKTCFMPSEGAGAHARCYVDSPIGEDGTFTETPDRGDPITVKKVA